MVKKRTRIDIFIDILSETKWPAKKTHIMKKANLHHHQVTRHLSRLVTRRLLWRDEVRGVYQLTAKGERYRREYAVYQRLKEGLTAQKATLEARKASLLQFFHGS